MGVGIGIVVIALNSLGCKLPLRIRLVEGPCSESWVIWALLTSYCNRRYRVDSKSHVFFLKTSTD